MKILMVCLGNICRSPLAEGILQSKVQKAGLNWTVESAGTLGHNIGSAPHKYSQKVAKFNGIDISTQTCKHFTKDDILRFDKIYVMDADNYNDVKQIASDNWDDNKVDYLLNELYPGENVEVPDPWYGGEDGFHEVYKMLDEACSKIIENNLRSAD